MIVNLGLVRSTRTVILAALAACHSPDHARPDASGVSGAVTFSGHQPQTWTAPRVPASVVARASYSSLCQAKQPLGEALKAIADMGSPWVDLSCLTWAPHISVPDLVEDFEREAARVEPALAANRLRISDLTFDEPERRPFDEYGKQFQALAALALSCDVQRIHLMAPPAGGDRQARGKRLRILQDMASRSGVLLSVETHCHQVTEPPTDAESLCRQVPGSGLTLDPSHYYAGPNQGTGFDDLYRLGLGTGLPAAGTSCEEIQLPWGRGPIDFAEVIRKLEAVGYEGFYVVEYIEGLNEVDPLVESGRFLEWLHHIGD